MLDLVDSTIQYYTIYQMVRNLFLLNLINFPTVIMNICDIKTIEEWDKKFILMLSAGRYNIYIPHWVASLQKYSSEKKGRGQERSTYRLSKYNMKVHIHPLRITCIVSCKGKVIGEREDREGDEGREVVYYVSMWIFPYPSTVQWNVFITQVEDTEFRGLTPMQSVGLRCCGYIIQLQEVVRSAQGDIDHLKVTCHKATDANRPKAFIHWVSKPIQCEVRLYEKL